MTVLGSREQYCVHSEAKNADVGVSEACVALLSGKRINSNGKIDDKKGSSGCNCEFRNQLSNKVNKEEPLKSDDRKGLADSMTYETFLKGLGFKFIKAH